jgi:hypothetical protein
VTAGPPSPPRWLPAGWIRACVRIHPRSLHHRCQPGNGSRPCIIVDIAAIRWGYWTMSPKYFAVRYEQLERPIDQARQASDVPRMQAMLTEITILLQSMYGRPRG